MYRVIFYVFNKDRALTQRFTSTIASDAELNRALKYYDCDPIEKITKVGEVALANGTIHHNGRKIELNIIKIK